MQSESIATPYGSIASTILQRAADVQLLICDVDGVLSNGLRYLDSMGRELKSYHVQDGYGIRLLLAAGLQVAIISCGSSQSVIHRARTLGIRYVYQGQTDKIVPFQQLLRQLSLSAHQVAYIGDDWPDWPVLAQVGLSVAVPAAHPALLPKVDYITRNRGGYGAVREVCDLILLAHNKLPLLE